MVGLVLIFKENKNLFLEKKHVTQKITKKESAGKGSV